ncbi:NXPE family member 1-like [Patiria miniata]|uniref:NXPE C-terminal domain-containing protein n=1 Tax=Patiria miniata TaxID=46514 RepID=A0A913ZHD5_PATMI|nr:NXPE family member 1-like [Patiria miniata]
MRRFRIKLPRLFLLALPVIMCVVVILGYAALSALTTTTTTRTVQDTTEPIQMVQKKYDVHVVTPAAWPRFNAIPTARNTKYIAQEVPGPVEKGLPGRWQHRRGNVGMTSYKTSIISPTSPANVTEGEMFRIMIEARDKSNQPRTMGGDFWYATLATKGGGSTSGRVLDHANGSYSVYFFAGWSGKASIHITMVHPSEAVDYLVQTVWNAYDRINWLGRFEDGVNKSTTSCVLRRGGPWTGKCELSHPYALGKTVLLCGEPAHGLKCDSLVAVYNNNTRIRERARELSKGRGDLFQGEYYSRRLSTKTIEIANDSRKDQLLKQLPECEPDQPKPLSSGYWRDSKTWVSLACRTKQWKVPRDIGRCLVNKTVYLLGDSTSRQWYELLSGMLGVPFVRKDNLEQNNIYRHFDEFNLTTVFKFHPLCLTRNPRPTPFNLFSFEVDVLDALKDKSCNYVILISPWAHYPQWTKDMFLERVSLLREALLRFRARCPNAPVVVKGSHPRDQPGLEGRIFYNNFMLYQLGKILRETFQGTAAWFLDIWDLNMAYPASKMVHMPEEVVKQELSMFLSYVCRKLQ